MGSPNSTDQIFLFGNISKDIIKTPSDEYEMTGGAILHAAWVAQQLGMTFGLLTKCNVQDKFRLASFPNQESITWVKSAATTSIHNNYLTADKETRICTNLSGADPYRIDDFPLQLAEVTEYCGLIQGEIDFNLIKSLASKTKLAIDAQGLLRKVFPEGNMEFAHFPDIEKVYPLVHYFKADAAEAEFLTGINTQLLEGRVQAAKYFHTMGAKEVIITHNENLTVFLGGSPIIVPFRNASLLGRTGRGDTCFCSYICARLQQDPKRSALFAAALTSMKMDVPGPFKKSVQDVETFIKTQYPEF